MSNAQGAPRSRPCSIAARSAAKAAAGRGGWRSPRRQRRRRRRGRRDLQRRQRRSIGTIANSGQIIGNVEIDNQASVTVRGGTGTTFGSWTGGTITIGAGNLTFAGGNPALGDNVEVDGVKGTVINKGPLQIATLAPLAVTGSFTQAPPARSAWTLRATLRDNTALAITGKRELDGGLGIDLSNGFTLGKGDSFDILAFGSLKGPGFDALALDGVACSVDLRRGRASRRNDRPHVAGLCRGARLARRARLAHP